MNRCAIEGCDKAAAARGWCKTHWARWRKHGDPSIVLPNRPGNKRQDHCDVEGCESPHHAGGYCSKHYAKAAKYGDPLTPDQTRFNKGRPLKGDQPGYDAIHRRLTRGRGSASQFQCEGCGGRAAEWAYIGGDPDELVTEPGARKEHPGLKYSERMELYRAYCVACHRQMDGSLDHTKRRNLDGTWGDAK